MPELLPLELTPGPREHPPGSGSEWVAFPSWRMRVSIAPERESGHLLGAIFSASPDAVVVVDASGRIILSSPAVTELFGYYPEELIGEPIESLIPAGRRANHASTFVSSSKRPAPDRWAWVSNFPAGTATEPSSRSR